MNCKKLLSPIFFSALLLLCNKTYSQSTVTHETFETVYAHWFSALDRFQSTSGADKKEYTVFYRFSEKAIDSLRGDFINKIGKSELTPANAKDYEDVLVKGLSSLYSKFKNIEQLYPSSVDEFRNYRVPMLSQSCDSACNNVNFETGNLSGWYAYYGVNESNTSTNITNITGGLAGAVTHAANDVLTSTPGYYNNSIGPNPSPDYQVNITSGSRHDGLVPSVPVVSPFGGHYSVMLGDSTQVNYGTAILSQTFKVTPSNENFTYEYAVFIENPANHSYYQQPFFRIAVLDQNGDTIPYCGEYYVVAQGGIPGFKGVYYAPSKDTVYYKDWTMVNVPLKHYLGQCVTVVFEVGDCALGGHFGYAYIDASCAPLSIEATSYVFCGQDSILLTGPAGEGRYKWTGPTKGIISNDTLRNIIIDSSGTYTVVVTPFTGASCNDTLTINIGKKAGPPPKPNFKGDTVCLGSVTTFTNTSNPINGGKFYWDFYNLGNYQDSTINSSWLYNIPGIYTVDLEELMPSGCGADKLVTIVVDSDITPSFIADTVCSGDTVNFFNHTTGATSYQWNFGDPSSGNLNTSAVINPYHIFKGIGKYSVTLTAKNSGCSNSVTHSVVILPTNVHLKLDGPDTVCIGTPITITASGAKLYYWSDGETTNTIKLNLTKSQQYTVTGFNGRCYSDTTINLYVKAPASGSITGEDEVCLNGLVVLTASGGGTYLWSTGATTSTITVPANSFADSSYSVIINNGKNCITLFKNVTIDSLYGYGCCSDTIDIGDTITLSGSGASKYYWEPPTGLSCDTCPDPTISPTVTTIYTLITTSKQGCKKSSLIAVDVDIPCRDFFIPNVFTPNGDGINDTYYIKVKYMSLYNISIYNRWGQEIFHSTDPTSPWDGTVHGSPAPAGVYYYIIRTTCDDGNSFRKDGFLQLIR